MKVTVIGLGYVGLVSAAGFAELGHEVRGTDIDGGRMALLRAGGMPFFEPNLDQAVARTCAAARLSFDDDPVAAVKGADVVIIAVGTQDQTGAWQTRSIEDCGAALAPHLDDGAALVVRSTLPPSSLSRLVRTIRAARAGAGGGDVSVLLNPEFTQEGTAVKNFLHPDRIVIGIAHDPDGGGVRALRRLYAGVAAPILEMSGADACLSKLGANLFLATKISFANELARLCDRYGAQVDRVVEAMSFDARIGGAFLRAGVGFGGSCLPHQVAQMVGDFDGDGDSLPLLAGVRDVNLGQRDRFAGLVAELVQGLAGRRIALLGLTFKPDTDDLRDAPSLPIARTLLERGATVVAYDPQADRDRAATLAPGIELAETALDALTGADAAALVTEWVEFRELDWALARTVMRQAIVVDGRNALDPLRMRAAGFTYAAFGRGVSTGSAIATLTPQLLRAAGVEPLGDRSVEGAA